MEIQLHLHVSIIPTETPFTAVFVYAQNLRHRQTILQNGWTNTLTLKLQKPFCPHHMHLRLSKRCKITKISDKTQALRSRVRANMAPRSSWIQAPSKREQPEAIETVYFWSQLSQLSISRQLDYSPEQFLICNGNKSSILQFIELCGFWGFWEKWRRRTTRRDRKCHANINLDG